MQNNLLKKLKFGQLELSNRIVMAPMNRRRADKSGVPLPWMLTYYEQRASAGLLITDNVLIAANAGEALNTPGIYSEEQIEAWQGITQAVHAKGGKIFMQLVHGGRMGHPANQHGLPLIAPSAIATYENIGIGDGVYAPMPVPRALLSSEVPDWVKMFKTAAENAIQAGFDGVEVHGAHGFLIDQFLNPHSNHRADEYGGSIVNRSRFLLEVVEAVATAIGKDRVGIRLSPFKEIYGVKPYAEEHRTHLYLLEALNKLDILYVHYSSSMMYGRPSISRYFLKEARGIFHNWLMVAGDYTPELANNLIESELLDLVAFGRLFISNPDLVERIRQCHPLAAWVEAYFYHGGPKGYIDYPAFV